MSKHFRYYFLLVIALLCISNLGNAKETGEVMPACLQNKLTYQHLFSTDPSKSKDHNIDADHSNEKNTFCRLGGERNLPTAKEQQYSSFDFTSTTFVIADINIYATASFQSYSTHIYSFLRSLLYPKHSFW